MKSIMHDERECYFCLTTQNLHKHHIYGGPNRSNSERHGMWVYLCARHHNMSDNSVHFNKAMDEALKCECEKKFISERIEWGQTEQQARAEFFGIIGRHYVDEEGRPIRKEKP